MKVTRTKTEELPLTEVGRLLIVDKEIAALFEDHAAKVVFEDFSYTSDQTKPKFDKKGFATLSRTDLASGVEIKVELTFAEVKRIVARAKNISSDLVTETFDSVGTGDGDGSSLYTVKGFKVVQSLSAPTAG